MNKSCPKCQSRLQRDDSCLICGWENPKTGKENRSAIHHSEALNAIRKQAKKSISTLLSKYKEAQLEEQKPNSTSDVECLIIEWIDAKELRKVIQEWTLSLSSCPDDDVKIGITTGMQALDAYLETLEKLSKEVFGAN